MADENVEASPNYGELEASNVAVTDDDPLLNLAEFDLGEDEDEDEDDLAESNMSLVDHLEELRWRIFKCLIVIAVGFVIAFIFRVQIINFLEAPLPSIVKHLVVTGLGEGFTVTLMVSFATGFALSLPVVLYQTWAFIAPGLYEKEKKYAVPFIFIGIILFVVGLSLAYYVLRYPVEWLITFAASNFTELVTASSYFGFVAFFMLAFGITFELPLVLTFLAKVDLLTIETLKKKRSTAHIGMWVAAAVLVPGADPYTPVILGAAMSILYEISIVFIRLFIK
jgi:sec-independent protein translocase protein TatC